MQFKQLDSDLLQACVVVVDGGEAKDRSKEILVHKFSFWLWRRCKVVFVEAE